MVLSNRIPDRTDSANNKTRLREHPGGFDASGDDVSLVQVFGRLEAFAFQALALELTGAANGLGTLTGTLFRRLLVGTAEFHFPENTLALHFLFQRLQGLIDIIVANRDLHVQTAPSKLANTKRRRKTYPPS
mgnify:CR=1 FL=1